MPFICFAFYSDELLYTGLSTLSLDYRLFYNILLEHNVIAAQWSQYADSGIWVTFIS